MAKSKARSKKRAKSKSTNNINWGGAASSGTGQFNLILGIITAAALIGGGVYWWQGRADHTEFLALAAQGQAALEQQQTFPNLGREHLRPGEPHSYGNPTPTSGTHDPYPINPGVYESPQPPTKLVHSLEHGMVVLYYDQPPTEVMEQLESWASLFSGLWDGVVVTRQSGLGPNVIATAWRKKLDLAPFDAAAAAAFIDAHRGRGPENPVR